MAVSNVWEPYFRPTRRVHDSGFRCFECGYLQIDGTTKRAAKKVIIARGVDHICNWVFTEGFNPTMLDMDLLKDGNIRLFYHGLRLVWYIPGFSDAHIRVSTDQDYQNELDELWEKQQKDGVTA